MSLRNELDEHGYLTALPMFQLRWNGLLEKFAVLLVGTELGRGLNDLFQSVVDAKLEDALSAHEGARVLARDLFDRFLEDSDLDRSALKDSPRVQRFSESLERELEELDELHRGMEVEHVAIQRHFDAFITPLIPLSVAMKKEGDLLMGTVDKRLCEARDHAFSELTAESGDAYLSTAKELLTQVNQRLSVAPYAPYRFTARSLARLQERTVELETRLLLLEL